MDLNEILPLPIVAFLAFFLKGIAGIGVSTVAVPILSLIIGAKQIVVLSSIVNVIGGLVMYRIDPQPAPRRYWCPIAAMMIFGAVIGGIALKLTPLKSFEKILGIAILAAGIWFIIWRGKKKSNSFLEQMPQKGCVKDYLIGFVRRVCRHQFSDIHPLFWKLSGQGPHASTARFDPLAFRCFKSCHLYRSGADEQSDSALQYDLPARLAAGNLYRKSYFFSNLGENFRHHSGRCSHRALMGAYLIIKI